MTHRGTDKWHKPAGVRACSSRAHQVVFYKIFSPTLRRPTKTIRQDDQGSGEPHFSPEILHKDHSALMTLAQDIDKHLETCHLLACTCVISGLTLETSTDEP